MEKWIEVTIKIPTNKLEDLMQRLKNARFLDSEIRTNCFQEIQRLEQRLEAGEKVCETALGIVNWDYRCLEPQSEKMDWFLEARDILHKALTEWENARGK